MSGLSLGEADSYSDVTPIARSRTMGSFTNQGGDSKFERYYRTPTCTSALGWVLSSDFDYADWVGTKKYMDDFVIPGFHKRSSRGGVFFNPVSIIEVTLGKTTGTDGAVKAKSKSCTAPNDYYEEQRYTNALGGLFNTDYPPSLKSLSGALSASDINAAVTQACTSCQNARGRSEQNLYETLAELNKSVTVLDNILRSAVRVVSAKRQLLQRAKDTSSAYLAYRYGLRPVMSDIEGVLLGLQKKTGRLRTTSRGYASISGSTTFSSPTPYNYGGQQMVNTTTVSDTLSVRAMALDEYVASIGSNVGFTTKGLATLPWELLPYSFVVDWFVNIGDFIGSLVPVLNAHSLGSCYVMRRDTQHTVVATSQGATTPASWTVTRAFSGVKNARVISTVRTPGLVAPGIVIKTDFRFNQMTRVLDSLALLVQKLR